MNTRDYKYAHIQVIHLIRVDGGGYIISALTYHTTLFMRAESDLDIPYLINPILVRDATAI